MDALCKKLTTALNALMPASANYITLGTIASTHGVQSDRMESLTKTFILVANYLQQDSTSATALELIGWYKAGILMGTDSTNANYWGAPTANSQHLQEMAHLAFSLFQTKSLIWSTYTPAQQAQITNYMSLAVAQPCYSNSWLCFKLMVQVFTNAAAGDIETTWSGIDKLYLPNNSGWYRDGIGGPVDLVNAYVFHYMLPAILMVDPTFAHADLIKSRLDLFCANFNRYFNVKGNCELKTRSKMFRFAVITPYIMRCLLSGKLTNILRIQQNMAFWMGKKGTLTTAPANLLSLDKKSDVNPTKYCSASVYAACTVFIAGTTVDLGM